MDTHKKGIRFYQETQHSGIGSLAGFALVLVVLVVLFFGAAHAKRDARSSGIADRVTENISSLAGLVALPRAELDHVDIALLNLLCAQSLPGSERLDVTNSLVVIERMASRVRSETERHLYRFRNNPTEFENSEGYFRMIMLMVVLAEDFGVRYASNKIANAAITSASTSDGFFADSRFVFLHGLTETRPEGTCSSLPKLEVAVGRRLGYPLKLVTTKGHLFVRWEDSRERFNFEAAGQGANRFTDDYYRHWPFEIAEDEVQAEGYLKSLTPTEELAVFLSIRGMCQQA